MCRVPLQSSGREHFFAFVEVNSHVVEVNSHVVELDGTKQHPIIYGTVGESGFFKSGVPFIKSHYIGANSTENRFSMIAVIESPPSQKGNGKRRCLY